MTAPCDPYQPYLDIPEDHDYEVIGWEVTLSRGNVEILRCKNCLKIIENNLPD